jgi:hypothetical protein
MSTRHFENLSVRLFTSPIASVVRNAEFYLIYHPKPRYVESQGLREKRFEKGMPSSFLCLVCATFRYNI